MEHKYNKQKRAIDFLPADPYKAIAEVCVLYDVDHILRELPAWLNMSFSHECSAYDNLEDRSRFIEFYDNLLPFIEAAYAFRDIKIPNEYSGDYSVGVPYEFQYITMEEIADPMIVIRRFCEQYPLLYVRIELWDFFQAVQFYDGLLKEAIYRYDTSCLHLYIQTLVEAFYLIWGQQHPTDAVASK